MQMKPQDQAATKQAFALAMKLMYDKEVFPIFEKGLTQDKPIPELLSGEASGLLYIINKKAKGKIPRQVLIPVGTMILMEMADFVAKAGIANPSKEEIVAAQKMLIEISMDMFGKQGEAKQPQGQPPQPQQGQPMPGGQPPMRSQQPQRPPQGRPMPQGGLLSQGV